LQASFICFYYFEDEIKKKKNFVLETFVIALLLFDKYRGFSPKDQQQNEEDCED